MNFEQLDRAARIAASKALPIFRPDVYQEAFVRFVRHAPLTFGGAYMMARHALIDLMRRERVQLHTELIDVIEETKAPDDTATLIAGLRALCPEETADLLIYYSKDHHTGAERIHAMRQRRIIKKRLKGD